MREIDEVMEGILEFATGKGLQIDLPMIPIADVERILKRVGYDRLEENDTNGWQVDFWYYFKKEDKSLCLSGSLFYGRYKLTRES
tara:strand:+ start:12104 stop:12358 length:255 start_codon:yes stop_codon:yes gene_type:complete